MQMKYCVSSKRNHHFFDKHVFRLYEIPIFNGPQMKYCISSTWNHHFFEKQAFRLHETPTYDSHTPQIHTVIHNGIQTVKIYEFWSFWCRKYKKTLKTLVKINKKFSRQISAGGTWSKKITNFETISPWTIWEVDGGTKTWRNMKYCVSSKRNHHFFQKYAFRLDETPTSEGVEFIPCTQRFESILL